MLLVASAAWAQSRNITGIVFDTDGKSPLVGATVILKGTATGTISNADGTYTIHVGSDNDVLSSSRWVMTRRRSRSEAAPRSTSR